MFYRCLKTNSPPTHAPEKQSPRRACGLNQNRALLLILLLLMLLLLLLLLMLLMLLMLMLLLMLLLMLMLLMLLMLLRDRKRSLGKRLTFAR